MTGKWSHAGVPHAGWLCTGVVDLGAGDEAVCEMCEVQVIRYVHVMVHSGYSSPLHAGCVCAGHMAGDPASARAREAAARNRARQRSHWLSRRWRRSRTGAFFVNTRDGLNVAVFDVGNGLWRARILERSTGRSEFSRRSYPFREQCQMQAFEAMHWLLDRGWGSR